MIWDVLATKEVFNAKGRVKVSVDTVRLPSGRIIDDYFQVTLPDFAIAIPILANKNILTLFQYKHGARRESLTFPAGQIESSEDPETAIRRELLEETGHEAGESAYLGEYVISGNQRCNKMHIFTLQDCHKVAEPNDDDLEETVIKALSVTQVDQEFINGNIVILPQATAWLAYRTKFPRAAE